MTLITRCTTSISASGYLPRYKRVEQRSEILRSLHTDSLAGAGKDAKMVWNDLILS